MGALHPEEVAILALGAPMVVLNLAALVWSSGTLWQPLGVRGVCSGGALSIVSNWGPVAI